MSSGPELCTTTETISISAPSWLVELVKRHCDLSGMLVSGMFCKGAKLLLLAALDKPSAWKQIYHTYKGES